MNQVIYNELLNHLPNWAIDNDVIDHEHDLDILNIEFLLSNDTYENENDIINQKWEKGYVNLLEEIACLPYSLVKFVNTPNRGLYYTSLYRDDYYLKP